MTFEKKSLDRLERLHRANNGSADIYDEAHSLCKNAQLRDAFRDLAAERRAQALDLARALESEGQDVSRADEPLLATLHEWWMKARVALQGDEGLAILAELERAEDRILKEYKDSIVETTGNPVNDMLHRHVSAVQKGHDRIKAMRDSRKSD